MERSDQRARDQAVADVPAGSESDSSDDQPGGTPVVVPVGDPDPAPVDRPDDALVDWVLTARRVGRTTGVLLGIAVLGWIVRAALLDRWSWSHLGNWLGLALAGIFAMELLVVGGSALRGMLRAGERGERLASHDVGLLPPVRRLRHPGDRQAEVDPESTDAGAAGDAVD